MLDFNDTPTPQPDHSAQRNEIRAALIARLDAVLAVLFPAGKRKKHVFQIGDVLGSPGDSLEVVLTGAKTGLWTDRATGDGGDIFDLIAAARGVEARANFSRVLELATELVGRAPKSPAKKCNSALPFDDLGPATAKWEYLDASGKLIALVYRYDPPGRKKEFRPWDAVRRKASPPEPRPLYNQPGLLNAQQVVLVEGEKCAQALIGAGICATTAMHGANAPVDKTDWSPLAGKAVLIWPDHDPGGLAYAPRAAQAVLAAGATRCDILHPPVDRPHKWDVANALAEGFDVAGFLAAGPRTPVQREADDAPPDDSLPNDLLAGINWSTEDGLATAFTRRFGPDWRYCALWGKWLVWNGVRWNPDQVLYAAHLVRGVCRRASRCADLPGKVTKLASAATVGAVEKLARSDPQHAALTDAWDADPWFLNTPTAVIDLRSGQPRAHRREDLMTRVTTAAPAGDCPRWRAFLRDVTGGDVLLQAYLARVAGYALTGSTREHALFFLYGTGANGKSVFVSTLASVLGDYATNAPMDTFMETRSDRHPTDMAGLRGARLVSAIETEQGRRWAESKLKALTGGDKISARFMRQDFLEYVPQFKLIVAGNHKPAIRNIDEAMKRRLHLIPFTVTIPSAQRDKDLAQKLLAERNGILAWAVAGCLEWQRIGLDPPPCVRDATDEYFEAEDAIDRWIEERCLVRPNEQATVAELFADWKDWADRAGEFVGSIKRFSQELLTRQFQCGRNRHGQRAFVGLSLKAKFVPSPLAYRDD